VTKIVSKPGQATKKDNAQRAFDAKVTKTG